MRRRSEGATGHRGGGGRSRSLAKKCFQRDNWRCTKCGLGQVDPDDPLVAHHVIPKEKGGPDELGNLTTLHTSCHREEHSGRVRRPAFNR